MLKYVCIFLLLLYTFYADDIYKFVQSLNSILDLSKSSTLTTSAISTLWTSYHQSKGFLSAAIPTEIYKSMILMGKKYPLFVLPLARDVIGDVPEGLAKEGGAVEMHLLVSSFLVLSFLLRIILIFQRRTIRNGHSYHHLQLH